MIENRINTATEEEIELFIQANYLLFPPDFNGMCESTKYYHKLYIKSTRFEVWDNNQLIGLLCCYFNKENKYAYVPYVCIRNDYSGKGLASKLFRVLTYNCQLNGYNIIHLEVRITNIPARNLYLKLGFKEISRNYDKAQLRKELPKII